MVNILVSSCLLGTNCKWNGKNNAKEKVKQLGEHYTLVPFCSEVLGGMPTPRIPSERVGDKVLNQIGLDATKNFKNGAKKVLELAQINKCKYAVLKDHSPSCGVQQIYDGNFQRKLIPGKGVTTELLESHGIKCFTEDEVEDLIKEIESK
jgi:uncharacterized protein YbbK (DUF523 family)